MCPLDHRLSVSTMPVDTKCLRTDNFFLPVVAWSEASLTLLDCSTPQAPIVDVAVESIMTETWSSKCFALTEMPEAHRGPDFRYINLCAACKVVSLIPTLLLAAGGMTAKWIPQGGFG